MDKDKHILYKVHIIYIITHLVDVAHTIIKLPLKLAFF